MSPEASDVKCCDISPEEKAWRRESMRESRIAELAEALLKASFGNHQYPQSAHSCFFAAQSMVDIQDERREILNQKAPKP